MNTYPQAHPRQYRLLVLVPHIEARTLLKTYSGQLFAARFNGAWSFPWVVPLAVLSKPLTQAELKQAALLMRELSLTAHESGKFTSGNVATTSVPDINILGPTLNITVPDLSTIARDKLLYQFSPLVAGSAIVQNEDCSAAPPPPALSFRAAAVANMNFSPMPQDTESGYSWQWKIDKLHWLPAVR